MRNVGMTNVPRRFVSEIDDDRDCVMEGDEDTLKVEAVHGSTTNMKCWNCEELGHHWQECLSDRRIFCYGCGAKDIYKPNCIDCRNRRNNPAKNSRPQGPPIE